VMVGFESEQDGGADDSQDQQYRHHAYR
jgi:hypothetical protein